MTEELDEIWENIVKAVYCPECNRTEDMTTDGMCPRMNHTMRACPARRASNKMYRRMKIRM